MKCPKCSNQEEFRVVMLRVEASGEWITLDENGEVIDSETASNSSTYEQSAFAPDGDATCGACRYEGNISEFASGGLPEKVGEFEFQSENAYRSEDILLRLVANFPGLVLDDGSVPRGDDLVEWLQNEFHALRNMGGGAAFVDRAMHGTPDDSEAPGLDAAATSTGGEVVQ